MKHSVRAEIPPHHRDWFLYFQNADYNSEWFNIAVCSLYQALTLTLDVVRADLRKYRSTRSARRIGLP